MKNTNFIPVPANSLFRDEKRLNRAVRLATLPLRYDAEQIAAGDKDPLINPSLVKLEELPTPPEGVKPAPPSPLKVPRDQILANVHRVLLVPMNSPDIAVTPEMAHRYADLIRAELAQLGWDWTESDKIFQLFGAAIRNAGGLYDPTTGHIDAVKAGEIRRGLFSAVELAPAPDAMLWVQIVREVQDQKGGNVYWDGVSQSAVDLGPAHSSFTAALQMPATGESSVKVASLELQLRDANDQLLYDARGGIQVLQQLKDKIRIDLPPDELFKDTTREQPAVHAALRELALSPSQIANEDHSAVPKSQ
jgi:hypothetical protein